MSWKARIQNLLFRKEDVKGSYGNISFSQCGEDIIVSYVMSLRDNSHFSYLDIGAHHPFFLSNTALFYARGCRGINIEANPLLAKNFDMYRSKDINLNIGVADREGEMDFYIMEDSTLSTFSKEECEKYKNVGKRLSEIKKIRVLSIAQILESHYNKKFPDFLSLDVEGMDLEILKSIDFSIYQPKVICVEAAEYSRTGGGRRRSELIEFLVIKGYFEYANTNLNAIMVRRDFWFI
jgi:FkbM family methyltransferase